MLQDLWQATMPVQLGRALDNSGCGCRLVGACELI